MTEGPVMFPTRWGQRHQPRPGIDAGDAHIPREFLSAEAFQWRVTAKLNDALNEASAKEIDSVELELSGNLAPLRVALRAWLREIAAIKEEGEV